MVKQEKRATYTTIVHRTLKESGLSATEFVVADVIDKLSNPWCTMSRPKIAEMVGLSESGLRKLLAKLEELGYIKRDRYKGLRSTPEWQDLVYREPLQSSAGTATKWRSDRYKVAQEPLQSSALYNNNYINKDISESEASQEPENPLPSYFGNSSLQRIVTAYGILWYETYGTPYKPNFPQIGKVFKPLLEQLNEWQIVALFIIHFNWHGANGDDERAFKSLDNAMFPIIWVPSKVNEYSTYLKNACNVNFEAMEGIQEYVRKEMGPALKRAVKDGIIKLPNKDESNG